MKNLISIHTLIFVIVVTGCNNPDISHENTITSKLDSLYQAESFFELKSYYNYNAQYLSHKNQLYYNSLLNFVFNDQEESIKLINQLLDNYSEDLNDTILSRIYQAKRMGHINTYEYGKAADASNKLIKNYEQLTDSSDYENYVNEHIIWTALIDVPQQEVIKQADCKIPMFRDKVGLMNVNTTIGNDSVNFLFDTGANFSAIIRSLAEDLSLPIIKADFYVTAATGKKVACDLTYVPELIIGDIIVKNSVFLVLDDEDLSFPQIDYYPNGAIGFPIIEAMEELRISRDGEIFVPKNSTNYKHNNLALNGLMPVVAAIHNGDTLRFNLDTGASATTLYSPFFERYKELVMNNYQESTFTSSSAGNEKTFNGYVIDSIDLNIGGVNANLSKVRLHKSPLTSSKEYVHGNLGQDFIKQFDEMIISFKHSSIVFK